MASLHSQVRKLRLREERLMSKLQSKEVMEPEL